MAWPAVCVWGARAVRAEPLTAQLVRGRPMRDELPLAFSRERDAGTVLEPPYPEANGKWWNVLLETNPDPATKDKKPYRCTICRVHTYGPKGSNATRISGHVCGDIPGTVIRFASGMRCEY